MTNQKQELTFQQQIKNKRQEILNYEEMLERYRTGPSRTNRWYNSGRRALEELNDELKALKSKHKRRVRLNMSLVRCKRRLPVLSTPSVNSSSLSVKRKLAF